MSLHALTEDELRGLAKNNLETLERWLRRLVHDNLTTRFGSNYIDCVNANGQKLIRKSVADRIRSQGRDLAGRHVDGTSLEDIIYLATHDMLFDQRIAKAFAQAFPQGKQAAKFYLKRLIGPRNLLYHANPISVRQAEQVICYSNDIIDSLKSYYRGENMNNRFNVPTFSRFLDSFGNGTHAPESYVLGTRNSNLRISSTNDLYPGDLLSIEVWVDQSFSREKFRLEWNKGTSSEDGRKTTIEISESDIDETYIAQCTLISTESWHRYGGYDDKWSFVYTVYPHR